MNLCTAVVVRKPAEIRALLASGADVNAATRGRLPLVVAAALGKTEIVALLLEAGANPNGVDREGNTALVAAAREGRGEVVALLLERGAEVPSGALAAGIQGETSGHLASVRRLISAGAPVEVDLLAGRRTLLMLASAMSSPEVVEELLRAGADPNALRPLGTALISAVCADRPRNVEVLLRHGADPTLRVPASGEPTLAGQSALDIAKSEGARAVVALLTGARRPAPGVSSGGPTPGWAVPELWERLRRHLERLPPEERPGLRPGASARDLLRLEAALGRAMPDDLRASCLAHDGQLPGVDLIPDAGASFGGFALLAIEEILDAWQAWSASSDAGEFADLVVGAAPGVREAWWCRGWIPFARNPHGDLLCVDTDPVDGIAPGRVIAVGHERPAREVLDDSFHAWLAALEERWGEAAP